MQKPPTTDRPRTMTDAAKLAAPAPLETVSELAEVMERLAKLEQRYRPEAHPPQSDCSDCDELRLERDGALRIAERHGRRVRDLERQLRAALHKIDLQHDELCKAWKATRGLGDQLKRMTELRDSADEVSLQHMREREAAERRVAELEAHSEPTAAEPVPDPLAIVTPQSRELEERNASLRDRVEHTAKIIEVMAPNRVVDEPAQDRRCGTCRHEHVWSQNAPCRLCLFAPEWSLGPDTHPQWEPADDAV